MEVCIGTIRSLVTPNGNHGQITVSYMFDIGHMPYNGKVDSRDRSA
jgi:hypothetical protein